MRLLINTIYQPFHHNLSQWEDPPDFITHPVMLWQIHILIHTNIHCIKPNYFCNYVSKFICIIVLFFPEHTVVFVSHAKSATGQQCFLKHSKSVLNLYISKTKALQCTIFVILKSQLIIIVSADKNLGKSTSDLHAQKSKRAKEDIFVTRRKRE